MNASKLPERLGVEELRIHFNAFVERLEDPEINLSEALDHLYELTIRQWYTFQLLEESLRTAIDQWLIRIWAPITLDKADKITFIVANLGLAETFVYMKSVYRIIHSPHIRRVIRKTILELENQVEDPYFAMQEYSCCKL